MSTKKPVRTRKECHLYGGATRFGRGEKAVLEGQEKRKRLWEV